MHKEGGKAGRIGDCSERAWSSIVGIDSILSWSASGFVEITAIERLLPVHEAQLIRIPEAGGTRTGLLVNSTQRHYSTVHAV